MRVFKYSKTVKTTQNYLKYFQGTYVKGKSCGFANEHHRLLYTSDYYQGGYEMDDLDSFCSLVRQQTTDGDIA